MAVTNPGQMRLMRWNPFERLKRTHSPSSDVIVRQWKDAWLNGAETRWSGKSAVTSNPYQPGSSQAAAWAAGWRWAEQQPDRRQSSAVRFAHPLRRSTDRTARLVRSAQAGAVGVSVVTLLGWLWQMQRKRRP